MREGEVGFAEDVSKHQLSLYEEQLAHTMQQYLLLAQQVEGTEAFQRRRRWTIFAMANKDISCVLEAKMRQTDACCDDRERLDAHMTQYHADDAAKREQAEVEREESARYVQANREQQKAVWNRIHGLYNELTKCQIELADLADARRKEIERRLRMEQREASRRAGMDAMDRVAQHYRRLLQDTIDNAEKGFALGKALNSFVLDQCESVSEHFDQVHDMLKVRLMRLRDSHLRCFTDYALKAGRLIDRKEQQLKREQELATNAEMMRELRLDALDPEAKRYAEDYMSHTKRAEKYIREITDIQSKLLKHDKDVRPTLRVFKQMGISFVHPGDVVAQVSLIRQGKVIDCRDNLLNPTQQSTIENEIRTERSDIRQLTTIVNSLVQQRKAVRRQKAIAMLQEADGIPTTFEKPAMEPLDERKLFARFEGLRARKKQNQEEYWKHQNHLLAQDETARSRVATILPLISGRTSGVHGDAHHLSHDDDVSSTLVAPPSEHRNADVDADHLEKLVSKNTSRRTSAAAAQEQYVVASSGLSLNPLTSSEYSNGIRNEGGSSSSSLFSSSKQRSDDLYQGRTVIDNYLRETYAKIDLDTAGPLSARDQVNTYAVDNQYAAETPRILAVASRPNSSNYPTNHTARARYHISNSNSTQNSLKHTQRQSHDLAHENSDTQLPVLVNKKRGHSAVAASVAASARGDHVEIGPDGVVAMSGNGHRLPDGCTVRAKYHYKGAGSDEISFSKGLCFDPSGKTIQNIEFKIC